MSDCVVAGEPRLGSQEYDRISRFVRDTLGIQLPPAKRTMVEARLRKQLRLHGACTYAEYVDHVLAQGCPAADRQTFLDLITTNKTDFYREPDHFDHLAEVAVPTLLAEGGSGRRTPFRVWSSACSSGEEPYTIALTLAQVREKRRDFDFQVLASDISRRILERAARAVYTLEQVKPVPLALQKRWFLRSKDPTCTQVKVAKELRRKVQFGQLNLMEPPYPVLADLDAVFCRNVMIYFDRPTQSRVIASLTERLRPGGYLYVGHSETAQTLCDGLVRVAPAVYRRTEG